MLYYKEGFNPIMASQRHPGAVLQSQGWRTLWQIGHPKKVRGKGLLAKYGDRYAPRELPIVKNKKYFKNDRSKLYEFVDGVYKRIFGK